MDPTAAGMVAAAVTKAFNWELDFSEAELQRPDTTGWVEVEFKVPPGYLAAGRTGADWYYNKLFTFLMQQGLSYDEDYAPAPNHRDLQTVKFLFRDPNDALMVKLKL